MAVNVNWMPEKSHTLHCHLEGAWTVDDLHALAVAYQRKTATRNRPFDVILTADKPTAALPQTKIVLPVHTAQRSLVVVNAYTFYKQLTDVLELTPSASMTVFVGSWNEAYHFVDGVV